MADNSYSAVNNHQAILNSPTALLQHQNRISLQSNQNKINNIVNTSRTQINSNLTIKQQQLQQQLQQQISSQNQQQQQQHKPFTYYQSPTSNHLISSQQSIDQIKHQTNSDFNYMKVKNQPPMKYNNISTNNQNNQQQQLNMLSSQNTLLQLQQQTQTAIITDDSYYEQHHRPLIDNNNINSNLNRKVHELALLNSKLQVKDNITNATGMMQRQSSEQVLKTIQNIKVQVSQNNNQLNQQSLHHNYSTAKLHTVSLDDNNSLNSNKIVKKNNTRNQFLLSKEYASLVVLSDDGSQKSDRKKKINTSRVISDHQMNQKNNSLSINQQINNIQTLKQHPKHSVVISASNKLSQLHQQTLSQHNQSNNSKSSMTQYQAAGLLSPLSVSSSHSTASLKHHISQQHQQIQQQLQQQVSTTNQNQKIINNGTEMQNIGEQNQEKILQKASINSDSQQNSSRNNSTNLQLQNSADKRTSINSYNKKVVELNLNQQQQIKDGLLKVGPQTMKNQAVKQLSLEMSDLPSQSTIDINSKYPETQKVEVMPGKSMNKTINNYQQNQYNSATNSTVLSTEKIKPQIKVIPISTNISPKNQNVFGSPRFSINSINNTKSKLMLRKQQQNYQTTNTSNVNKSGINLSRSEQQLPIHNSTVLHERESINSGKTTLQVSQPQSLNNFKHNSPQFNRFIQQSKVQQQQSNCAKKHMINIHNQTTLSQYNKSSQNSSQQNTQLVRNLSQDAGLCINNINNLAQQQKQLKVSESQKDLKFNSGQDSKIAAQSQIQSIQQQNYDNKRESQRYYSPSQMSLNKALSRISSVGEFNKAKNQITTQRKSIQTKQQQNNNNSINTNSSTSGLTTILTAHLVMQNAQKQKPINDNNNNTKNQSMSSRSQDRKISQDLQFDKSKSLQNKNKQQIKSPSTQVYKNPNKLIKTERQIYSYGQTLERLQEEHYQNEYDNSPENLKTNDQALCSQEDDDNDYMTNQEKLWSAIETNQDFKIIEELLKKNDVKVDQKNIFDDSWTALHYAVHEGNMPVIKLLIEKYQASIDQRSATNKTPFHLACIRGEEQIIKYLLESGASSHVVDRDGCTPLHYLCETENHEMVKLLLPVAGASKDVRNRFGKKPVDLIQDKEMKRLLRNYSTRRESQTRLTLHQQQQSNSNNNPKSISRERSKSGCNNVIQINRLNDDKEVQDSIQQMFRKFSLFQNKNMSKERQIVKQNRKDQDSKVQNNGNLSQRNVSSQQDLNSSGKKINQPVSRLTLAPQTSKQQIPSSQSQTAKSNNNKKQNMINNSKPQQLTNNNSNLILKNISPTKQINLISQTTTASQQQTKANNSLNSSQSVKNLNSKTPVSSGLQSVKSQSKLLDFSQAQNSNSQQQSRKLASVQSVTSLLQEKQKQLEKQRIEQSKQQQQSKITLKQTKLESNEYDQVDKGQQQNMQTSTQQYSNEYDNQLSQEQQKQNNIIQNEDQGSLSQRTGDSSHINNDMITTSIVNKNHKMTTFSLNQLSDNNGQEIEENKQEQNQKIGPWSFIAHQLLGTGSFGEVFLVEKISNGKFYAMKVLTKAKIMGHNLTRYAMTERNVMSVVNHPFVVKLNYAFQTQEKLFLILDYCPGGDLAEYLQLEKRFNEDKVRLYSSEILLALEELHRKDIIFRDLKPDNVVLDQEGHAMLTDFGLSKEGVLREGMAKSFCGSYAYLAPEMLKKVGHGKAVDWYLLGVIIYEMLCGVPPYYANNKEELFENIKNMTLEIPQYVSPVAKDIILRLLNRNPKKRLGTINGADEIKKHPFFKNIDWTKLFHRAYRAPEPYLRKRFENFLAMSPALQTNAEVYESLRKQALFKGPGENDQHIPGWSFVSPVKDTE